MVSSSRADRFKLCSGIQNCIAVRIIVRNRKRVRDPLVAPSAVVPDLGPRSKFDVRIVDQRPSQFVAKAPEEVIEEQRSRRLEAVDRRERIALALARLS